MLLWAIVFLSVASLSGLFAFAGIAAASAGIAQILFQLFLLLAVAAFLLHQMEDRF